MSSKLLFFNLVLIVIFTVSSCVQSEGDQQNNPEVSDYHTPELKMKPKTKPGQDTTEVKEVKEEVASKIVPENRTAPDKAELDRRSRVRGLFEEGIRLLKRNDYSASVQKFDMVIQLDPDNSSAYYNRGFAYYHLDMYSEANADFDRSIELNPKDSSSFLYKGMMKYFRDDFEGSIEEYNKSIARAPHYSKAYYNRGLAKGQLQDIQGAINDFNKAIELDPFNKDAYYNKAFAYFVTGDTATACANWQKAKELGSATAAEAMGYYCKGK